MTVVAAVDWGAASIRTCRVDLDTLDVDVVHRVAHQPVTAADGTLRWDWDHLMDETIEGLELALAKGPVASIGVDTWAVDYGLVDADGKLLSAPHSYRSRRTAHFGDTLQRIGRRRFYEICGLQSQPFNTVFQLAVHDSYELEGAASLLFLPDLIVQHLTGEIATERTNAGSSGLYDLATRDWSDELIAATGAPRRLFTGIVDAPSSAGTWRDIPVTRVGGHDTASAVVAIGDVAGSTAFVSSGTWLLVGRLQDEPDTSEEAQKRNFTNELGALGGVRFLKNVTGYWLLNECMRIWGTDDAEPLLEAAKDVDPSVTFDATDPRLLHPEDMESAIRDLAGLRGGGRETVVRCIIESMAATTAGVLASLPEDSHADLDEVVLLGGGTRDELLCERIAHHSGLPVRRGPAEATAIGNALVQARALT